MELENILKDLYLVSGFNMSVFDLNFDLVSSYPKIKSPLCLEIEKNKDGLAHCLSCDRLAFERVKQTNQIYIYQCYYGLYEAVAPLYDGQILIGYLMMGQTINESDNDYHYIYEKALPYINDKQLLKGLIKQTTHHSIEQIRSHIEIMTICASYITLTKRLQSLQKDLASEIRRYIDVHYMSDFSIDDLCKIFYCSRGTLTKTFRQKYNQSILQYITDLRMAQAKQLLETTTLNISEIALQCGYLQQNYFSKVFIKYYHVTPSKYRKEIMAK